MDYLGYDKKPKAMKICRLTGLHLLSALIYNGFPYYDKAADQLSEAVFLDRLLNNLSGPREVYKSASEVSVTTLSRHTMSAHNSALFRPLVSPSPTTSNTTRANQRSKIR